MILEGIEGMGRFEIASIKKFDIFGHVGIQIFRLDVAT